MNPEYLKDIFTKHSDFQKPKSSQLVKLLANGLVNHEDEKWAKHRKIINPAFHMEKLKVFIYSLRTFIINFVYCLALWPTSKVS